MLFATVVFIRIWLLLGLHTQAGTSPAHHVVDPRDQKERRGHVLFPFADPDNSIEAMA